MVKATPLVYSSVRKNASFSYKTPIFGANLIKIRVKRSKVKVSKGSYLNYPDMFCGKNNVPDVVKGCIFSI